MTSYKDSPEHQKLEGNDLEWKVFHLFQEKGDFCGIHLQDGKNSAALICYVDYNLISPDLLVLRGADRFLVECKSKQPTSFGTYGFPEKTISHYLRIQRDTMIDILFVVYDKSIASVGSNDPSAYRIAILDADLFQGAVLYKGTYYFRPERFQPFIEFLEEDKEDFDSYNAHMAEYRAGKREHPVVEVQRLIDAAKAEDAEDDTVLGDAA